MQPCNHLPLLTNTCMPFAHKCSTGYRQRFICCGCNHHGFIVRLASSRQHCCNSFYLASLKLTEMLTLCIRSHWWLRPQEGSRRPGSLHLQALHPGLTGSLASSCHRAASNRGLILWLVHAFNVHWRKSSSCMEHVSGAEPHAHTHRLDPN